MKTKLILIIPLMFLLGCAEDPDVLTSIRQYNSWNIDKMTISYATVTSDGNGNESLESFTKNVFLGGTVQYIDTTFISNDRGEISDYETLFRISPTDEDIDPNDYNYQQVPFTKSTYIFSRRVIPYDDYTYTEMSNNVTFYSPGIVGDFVILERHLKGDRVLLMLTKNQDNGYYKGVAHFELELSPLR